VEPRKPLHSSLMRCGTTRTTTRLDSDSGESGKGKAGDSDEYGRMSLKLSGKYRPKTGPYLGTQVSTAILVLSNTSGIYSGVISRIISTTMAMCIALVSCLRLGCSQVVTFTQLVPVIKISPRASLLVSASCIGWEQRNSSAESDEVLLCLDNSRSMWLRYSPTG
jgi:hypothetical protein